MSLSIGLSCEVIRTEARQHFPRVVFRHAKHCKHNAEGAHSLGRLWKRLKCSSIRPTRARDAVQCNRFLSVLADRVCGTRTSVKRVRFVNNCGRFRLRDSQIPLSNNRRKGHHLSYRLLSFGNRQRVRSPWYHWPLKYCITHSSQYQKQ